MANDAQGDPYSDDDLDALPPNTLAQLEQQASFATQQKKETKTSLQLQPFLPTGNSNQLKGHQQLSSRLEHDSPREPSSDYGFDDEDVIDLDAQHLPAQSIAPAGSRRSFDGKWHRPNTNNGHSTLHVSRPPPKQAAVHSRHKQQPDSGFEDFDPPEHPLETLAAPQRNQTIQSGIDQLDISELQARIQELEEERLGLQKLADDANSFAQSKAGEIAIVRAKNDKVTKEYENRLSTLQKLLATEVEKGRVELEAERKEKQKIATDIRFLEHDLAQEAERARNLKKTLKDGTVNFMRSNSVHSEGNLTPKISRHVPFRDGFEDDEVVLISPSKSKEKSKPSTPRAGSKRKRPLTEKSPGKPLPLSEPERLSTFDQPEANVDVAAHVSVGSSTDNEKFHMLQMVLNHYSYTGHERTFEALSRFTFPSAPRISLASLLYDDMADMPAEQDSSQFGLYFCNMLLSLWSKCLHEQYYDALHDVSDLLYFVLTHSSPVLSTNLVQRLMPLCLATADLIALPTAKAANNRILNQPPSESLTQHIDPIEYLELLQLTSVNCRSLKEDLVRFWSAMEFDFILLLLHRSQALPQTTMMLQLLSSSILSDSFGAIVPSGAMSPKQRQTESDIIDRLTNMLLEAPHSSTSTDPKEHPHLRSEVLSLLRALCNHPHSSRALANHPLAFGRLIRSLHTSIKQMYAHHTSTHPLTTHIVNTTVLILGHITACHTDILDVRARLAAVPGGAHKHLVTLSRIAFAEGYGLLERGILSEAAEAAHRMLDEHLSPEEGEAVVEVFSSAPRE